MPHGDSIAEAYAPRHEPLPRGAGTGLLLFIDGSISGIAGDMLVAATLDLGVPLGVIEEALGGLPLGAHRIELTRVERSGIAAARFRVHAAAEREERSWATIRGLLEGASTLTEGARRRALAAFQRLAQAEASVHGVPVDAVVFHEVGAVDSIVDVVAAAVALDHLGAAVVGSPVPLGHGLVQARHGPLPLPAPATVVCLAGVPTFEGGVAAELVTPTGAALLASATERFERWPPMRPARVGWGAGTRELPDRPNVVRVVLGEPTEERSTEPLWVLEANVDDMSPEIASYVAERLLDAGALDAWLTPILMKKGRPGTLIAALARPADTNALRAILLSESTSLGVRVHATERLARPRRVIEVPTRFGPIAVKIADGDGLPPNVAPELEACRRAAAEHGVPLKAVYAAALAAVEGG